MRPAFKIEAKSITLYLPTKNLFRVDANQIAITMQGMIVRIQAIEVAGILMYLMNTPLVPYKMAAKMIAMNAFWGMMEQGI